jgi:hypothetical protein
MGLMPQSSPPPTNPLLYPLPRTSCHFTSQLPYPQYGVCTSAHPDYIPTSSSSCFLQLLAKDSNHPRQDLCGHHPKQQVSCFPNTKNSGSNWVSKRTGLSAAPTKGRECKVSYRVSSVSLSLCLCLSRVRSLTRVSLHIEVYCAVTLENAHREKERETMQHREFVW